MPKKKTVDNAEVVETKETVQENPEQESEKTEQESPEQESENADQEEPEQEQNPEAVAEEPVLFCVTPKEKKVALRSTPEFRMDNKNLAGIVDENSETRVFKVVEVKNGYGRLLYPAGLWIALNACNRL